MKANDCMEQIARQLVNAFSESWIKTAAPLLERPTALNLLALREVSGDGMASALAVVNTWSAAFVASCPGSIIGLLICLFKSEEILEIERLVKQQADGLPKPGSRALIDRTLEQVAAMLNADSPKASPSSPAVFIDLTIDESRLSSMAGDAAWVGTFSLNIGDDIDTQIIVLYAPHGSLESATQNPASGVTDRASVAKSARASATPTASVAPVPSRRASAQRREEMPRNIERLLDVELDVIVRFGITTIPLRDVVRMGVGTMIELNRAIDEPVELLVNGRPLARGEVVIVDGYYGVRITEIGAPAERALSIL